MAKNIKPTGTTRDPTLALARQGVLSDIAKILVAPLEHDCDAYSRIIHLFKMQLFWFFPAKLRLSKPGKLTKKLRNRAVDSDIILRGRMLAAIEIIDKLLPKIRVAGLRKASRSPQDPFYGNFEVLWPIFREHLWPERSHYRVVFRMRRKKALRQRIQNRIGVTEGPAKIVLVLYQARQLLSRLYPTYNALNVVFEVVHHKSSPLFFGLKRTMLGQHWSEMKHVAIFHYLLRYHNFPFNIVSIQDPEFVPKMLELVRNIEGLRSFFCAHDHVATTLNERGYEFPILGVDRGEAPPHVDEIPLDEWVTKRLKTGKEDIVLSAAAFRHR